MMPVIGHNQGWRVDQCDLVGSWVSQDGVLGLRFGKPMNELVVYGSPESIKAWIDRLHRDVTERVAKAENSDA